MKVKVLEQLDDETVESWEDRGPTRAVVFGAIEQVHALGVVEAVKLA